MDRISTMEFAIKNETKEAQFYRNEAARSKNLITKALFESLAEDEEDHIVRIKTVHDKLIADEKWPEDVPIEVAGTNVVEALNNVGRNLASAKEHDDDDIKALQRAVDVEKEGQALYEKLAAASTNQVEIDFFLFLAKIEEQHLNSVLESLLYLEDPEGWNISNNVVGC